MGEFGHHSVVGNGFHLDGWGAGPFTITFGKLSFRFEDSDRFGPALVNRKGDPLATPWPSARSPFWRTHRIWVRQGRRLTDDDLTCIWTEPKPTYVRRLNRRNVIVVESGEEDGETIEVGSAPDDTP